MQELINNFVDGQYNGYFNDILKTGLNFLISIIVAFIVWKIGKYLTKFIVRIFDKAMSKGNMDAAVRKFLCSFANIVLKIVILVAVVQILGFETSSLIAIVGSAGVAIGLALQNGLGNLAGGVLILIFKPFAVGDYIIVDGQEGFVDDMDLLYTRLRTFDGTKVMIPNGKMSSSSITNTYQTGVRRVSVDVGVPYDSDLDFVKKIAKEAAKKTSFAIKDKPCDAFVLKFADSSIMIKVIIWVKCDQYYDGLFELNENIKKAFDANDINIPFNQLDVHFDREEK